MKLMRWTHPMNVSLLKTCFTQCSNLEKEIQSLIILGRNQNELIEDRDQLKKAKITKDIPVTVHLLCLTAETQAISYSREVGSKGGLGRVHFSDYLEKLKLKDWNDENNAYLILAWRANLYRGILSNLGSPKRISCLNFSKPRQTTWVSLPKSQFRASFLLWDSISKGIGCYPGCQLFYSPDSLPYGLS